MLTIRSVVGGAATTDFVVGNLRVELEQESVSPLVGLAVEAERC